MEEVRKLNYEGQTIFIGLDVHKKDWKVSIHFEDIAHKRFTMDPEPEKLAHYLRRNFPGASYQSVYEAGFSGYGACRNLNALEYIVWWSILEMLQQRTRSAGVKQMSVMRINWPASFAAGP